MSCNSYLERIKEEIYISKSKVITSASYLSPHHLPIWREMGKQNKARKSISSVFEMERDSSKIQ
jgi:hypothetical protein